MDAFSTDMASSIRENWAKTKKEKQEKREKETALSLGKLRKEIYDSLCVKTDAHKGIVFKFENIIHITDIITFIEKLGTQLPNATICWEYVEYDNEPTYPDTYTWVNLATDKPENDEWITQWRIQLYSLIK